jgi:hypothetical protein
MRESFLLSALIVFVFISTASADQVSVSFCIDADMDDWCDEEFTALVERDGMTDMDLLEIAFEDELMIYDWDEYLWAVSVEGDDYDYLPQFDGASDVYLEDGYEVYVWFTGWRWYSPGTGPSMPEAQGNPAGPGSGTGGYNPGPSIPGSAEVTAVSSWLKGYSVEVDGVIVGTEGTGSDLLDGIYRFSVSGNQQHDIKVNHLEFWKSWNEFFIAGKSYKADIDVPGRIVLVG